MCPWRNWIAHLIPIQKVTGSSPVGHAKVINKAAKAVFFVRYYQKNNHHSMVILRFLTYLSRQLIVYEQ